jgi:copper chaperone
LGGQGMNSKKGDTMTQILKFKTSLKCGGCKATITPFLDAAKGIEKWELDLEHPDRILTIYADGISADKVQNIFTQAGYTAEILV